MVVHFSSIGLDASAEGRVSKLMKNGVYAESTIIHQTTRCRVTAKQRHTHTHATAPGFYSFLFLLKIFSKIKPKWGGCELSVSALPTGGGFFATFFGRPRVSQLGIVPICAEAECEVPPPSMGLVETEHWQMRELKSR